MNREQQLVKCTECGHTAPYEDWPKGRDFFQSAYIYQCLNPECANRQSPGDASMRMMAGGQKRPFVFVRPSVGENADPLEIVLHAAGEAS